MDSQWTIFLCTIVFILICTTFFLCYLIVITYLFEKRFKARRKNSRSTKFDSQSDQSTYSGTGTPQVAPFLESEAEEMRKYIEIIDDRIHRMKENTPEQHTGEKEMDFSNNVVVKDLEEENFGVDFINYLKTRDIQTYSEQKCNKEIRNAKEEMETIDKFDAIESFEIT